MLKEIVSKSYLCMKNIRTTFEMFINKIMFWYFSVDILGKPDYILGILTIRSKKRHSIVIDENVKFHAGRNYNIIGGDSRLIFRTLGKGVIRIGKNVGISNSSFVSSNSIQILDDVMIGGNCKFWDNDFHSLSYEQRMDYPDTHIASAPILVKRGAFIGANTIVLKGVTIGEKSIVGAGSVLTKDIPDGEIWAGNPAKFIRKI